MTDKIKASCLQIKMLKHWQKFGVSSKLTLFSSSDSLLLLDKIVRNMSCKTQIRALYTINFCLKIHSAQPMVAFCAFDALLVSEIGPT